MPRICHPEVKYLENMGDFLQVPTLEELLVNNKSGYYIFGDSESYK